MVSSRMIMFHVAGCSWMLLDAPGSIRSILMVRFMADWWVASQLSDVRLSYGTKLQAKIKKKKKIEMIITKRKGNVATLPTPNGGHRGKYASCINSFSKSNPSGICNNPRALVICYVFIYCYYVLRMFLRSKTHRLVTRWVEFNAHFIWSSIEWFPCQRSLTSGYSAVKYKCW